MDIQYLASMAASRRALPADQTAAWIQRLRIYIVIRAMDALEANAVRESQGIGHIATRVPELIEDASNELPGSFRLANTH